MSIRTCSLWKLRMTRILISLGQKAQLLCSFRKSDSNSKMMYFVCRKTMLEHFLVWVSLPKSNTPKKEENEQVTSIDTKIKRLEIVCLIISSLIISVYKNNCVKVGNDSFYQIQISVKMPNVIYSQFVYICDVAHLPCCLHKRILGSS